MALHRYVAVAALLLWTGLAAASPVVLAERVVRGLRKHVDFDRSRIHLTNDNSGGRKKCECAPYRCCK
jgi:hypothetical protein